VLVAVEEADSIGEEIRRSVWFVRSITHVDCMAVDLLRSKVDQRCACSRYHVQICYGEEEQSACEREALPIVESRIRELYQTGPESV
jgi:hypothetical protein